MSDAEPVIFDPYGHPLGGPLVRRLPALAAELDSRSFPDGETYLRIPGDVAGRDCIVLAELSRPDPKFLPLGFLASTLREMNAASVGLVAPYLSYMRQDRRFLAGEALTSRIFAALLSAQFDWMVTVDPHLHRYKSLGEIYSMPTRVVQGALALSEWLANEPDVFLVGPDQESEQWVSAIAANCGLPYVIGEKERAGDRSVSVRLPDLSSYAGRGAVIVDDVISSGNTILQCIQGLRAQGVGHIQCACVHGIFADRADVRIAQAGIDRMVTTNSIPHSSNLVDLSTVLVPAIEEMLAQVRRQRGA